MTGNSITLPTAYMIETLRSNGASDNEILTNIEQKNSSLWEELESSFDYNNLIELYEQDSDAFKSIIHDGYTIKFVTIRGLQNLLKLKFDKIAERDYQLTDKGINQLKIDNQQLTEIKQILSINWIVTELDSHNDSQQTKEVSILLQ